MTRINDFANHLNDEVEGQFMMTEAADRKTDYGHRFKLLMIADATGNQLVHVHQKSGLMASVPLITPAPVRARLSVRRIDGEVEADLLAIRTLEDHEVENAAALLPLEDCPAGAHKALADLVGLTNSLECPHLRGFFNRVLLDERVSSRFLTCRASEKHHHAQPGGLLIHSMDVCWIATRMIWDCVPDEELEIIQVAAVLHDLGKLRSVGTDRVRPVSPKFVRHETQTNRMLEYHLEWLKLRAPGTGACLEYIFDFLGRSWEDRGYGKFIGADVVVYADHVSTGLDLGRSLDDLLAGTPLARRPGNRRSGGNVVGSIGRSRRD